MLLHDFLTGLGFHQSASDNCVYSRFSNGIKCLITVWVDDLLICCSNIDVLNGDKRDLCSKFKMKDFGQISNFLGIQFEVSKGSIKMHQSKFTAKVLEKFGMTDCKPKLVPCDMSTVKIDQNDDSSLLSDITLYREITGSLIYLMSCTRPDISYAVNKLAQRMNNPTNAHLSLAKHVLRFLKGTLNQGLVYSAVNEPIDIICYTDSDWGSDPIDRRSISGYVFQLSETSSVISYKSKKQPTVALSTCEAEYMALAYAVQEALFLKQLIFDMTQQRQKCVTIYVDNQGTIDLAKNPVHHMRSKHIDIRYHFIRHHVQLGNVELLYVPSDRNVADLFTKPASSRSLNNFALVQ